MRELAAEETNLLRPCLEALAAHHNQTSRFFKGTYPSAPYEKTLAAFRRSLQDGRSRIAVAEQGGQIVGFCKIDVEDGHGKLDYLVVQACCRGKGYGAALMEWALAAFARADVHEVEVKVVDGNDALSFYERYGFRMNAHILRRSESTRGESSGAEE